MTYDDMLILTSLVDKVFDDLQNRIHELEIKVLETEQYTESLERQIKRLKCNKDRNKTVANAE